MRVAIITWGSRGDFQPYLALAVALRAAGHEVRLAAPSGPGFSRLAEDHDVDLLQLGPDVEREAVDEVIRKVDYTTLNPVALVRITLDRLLAVSTWDEMYSRCLDLASWSDVVVCHFLQVTGKMVAEAAGRPFVSGTIVPTQLPTSTRPPGGSHRRGGFRNRRAWKIAVEHMNAAWLPPVNEARARAGLSLLDDLAHEGFYSSELNILAVSPNVFRRPDDWPARHRLTGYWQLPTASDWTPSPELIRFLSNGPPPVAIGFGSVPSNDTEQLNHIVMEAVQRAKMRAVLQPGMAGLVGDGKSSEVLVTEGPEHSWLLPRVAALVHHGGAGTTGTALHAGIPQVIVPHLYDQHFWAGLAHQLGVAPSPIPIADLNPERLSSAVRAAVWDTRIRARARSFREILSQEHGAEKAVRLIEEYAGDRDVEQTTGSSAATS